MGVKTETRKQRPKNDGYWTSREVRTFRGYKKISGRVQDRNRVLVGGKVEDVVNNRNKNH